ncbi:hypothetical protein SAMD00079811_49260 [Scytonema sp. HK-05]|nr:hypothetical protein SAMD00079811_49260 [Scytonema sp. HK-05]
MFYIYAITLFNSEQLPTQLSVKYEWSRVPHQERVRRWWRFFIPHHTPSELITDN